MSDGTYIYILGGNVGGTAVNTLTRYNVAANTYTTLATLPVPATYQAAAYLNGKIYRIGGCISFGCTTMATAVDVYTVATNTWAGGPAYPLALDNNSAVAYNGFIYVAGGKDAGGAASNKTYRLDPVASTWDDAVHRRPARDPRRRGRRHLERTLDPGRGARHLRPAAGRRGLGPAEQ